MHVVIEKARRAAGISGLTKNYPDNPKHRGAGHWAGFIGSVSTQLAELDAQSLADAQEAKARERRIAELEHALNEARSRIVKEAVLSIGLSEGWSEDKRRQTVARIAN